MNNEPFNPWLSPEALALIGRQQQVYPLDPPYKPKDSQHPYTKWVVRARPGDPDSPLIWGKYAFMMVCGGYFKPADKRKALNRAKGRKPRVIKKDAGYDDDGHREVIHEPDVTLSTQSTTSTLIGAMGNAGFTEDEAKATLERFPLAGGAYWHFMHQYPDHEKTKQVVTDMFHNREYPIQTVTFSTGEVGWLTEPLSITHKIDPWGAWHPSSNLVDEEDRGIQSLEYYPGLYSKDLIDSLYVHPVTGRETRITRDRAEAVLFQVKQLTVALGPHDRSPYIVGTDENPKRVATVNGILECPEFRFSYAKGALREGYIPWLLEVGALVEHTGVRKIKKASGRTPHNGYTVAPNVSLGDLYPAWRAPVPVVSVPVKDIDRETVSEPLTMEMILEMMG